MKSVIVIPTVLLAILLACIPVYAVAGITGENTPSINVSVSPASPVIGDTVTISGTATGGNLTPGVHLWIFAGNYVNITDIPVNANGAFETSINTTGYPPAYYYIFVQHPGSDTKFNIDVSGYAGEVINENTGDVIFNFTGNGSIHDNAAAVALSNALNQNGVDDIFAKAGVTLNAPGTPPLLNAGQNPILQATIVAGNASQSMLTQQTTPPVVPAAATSQPPGTVGTVANQPGTTKTPLPIDLIISGILFAFILIGISGRRR